MKKVLKQIFILSIISLIFLIPFVTAGSGYKSEAECSRAGVLGICYEIDHGDQIPCIFSKKIINSHTSNNYFIPLATTDEFDAFVLNPPAGISVTNCAECTGKSKGTSCMFSYIGCPAGTIEDGTCGPRATYGACDGQGTCVKSGDVCQIVTTSPNPYHSETNCYELGEDCEQFDYVTTSGTYNNVGDCVASTTPVVLPPVDGGWSSNFYGECSATCEGGHRTVTRYCITPAPANGGTNCVVDTYRNEFCSEWGSTRILGVCIECALCYNYAFENLAWDQTGTTETAIGLISVGTQYETMPQSADDYDGLNHCNEQSCDLPPTDTASPPLIPWGYTFENGELIVIYSNGDLVKMNDLYGSVDSFNIDLNAPMKLEGGDLTITYKDGTSDTIPGLSSGAQADYTQGGVTPESVANEAYITGVLITNEGTITEERYFFWSDGQVTMLDSFGGQVSLVQSTIPAGAKNIGVYSDGITRSTFWSDGSVTLSPVDDNIYAEIPVTPVNRVATRNYAN
jgi:hypothetical protein